MTDQPHYPYADGDRAILGPEVSATADGMTIRWKGANYRRDHGGHVGAATPLICSDERHATKVAALQADLDRYEEVLGDLNETLVDRAKQAARAEAERDQIREDLGAALGRADADRASLTEVRMRERARQAAITRVRSLAADMRGSADTRWFADQLTGALDGAPSAPATTRYIHVTITNRDEYTANRAALSLVDWIHAEFPGLQVTTDAHEWDDPAAAQATDDAELTADEARNLVDELGADLYRAQDALAFVGECCDIADREQKPITTADVREWLKGARCGRQLAADAAAATEPATCCVCGGGPVVYRNYRDQPFCWPCADCACCQNPCVRTGINDPAVADQPKPEPAMVTDPEYLRQQYAAIISALHDNRPDHIAAELLRVHDRHLQQLRQRLQLADELLATRDTELAAAKKTARGIGAWGVLQAIEQALPQGPTVAEAAADDARWPLEKEGT